MQQLLQFLCIHNLLHYFFHFFKLLYHGNIKLINLHKNMYSY